MGGIGKIFAGWGDPSPPGKKNLAAAYPHNYSNLQLTVVTETYKAGQRKSRCIGQKLVITVNFFIRKASVWLKSSHQIHFYFKILSLVNMTSK